MRPPPARALRPSPRYRAASRWRRAGRGAGSRARDQRAGAPQRRAGAPHAAARPGADSRGVGQSPRLPGASALRIFGLNAAALDTHAPFRRGQPMRVATDYIRHAARLARKSAGEPLGGAPQPPDPEFYRTLAKALEEIAAGLEQLGKEE